MSIKSEIDRIKAAIAAAYGAVQDKGGTIPSAENAANLAQAIGSIQTGTDVSGVTATPGDVLAPKKFVNSSGALVTGTMQDVSGAISITSKSAKTIPAGYHDGTFSARISSAQRALIVADNIRKGITMLGVDGGFSNFTQMETGTWTPSARITTSNNTSSANRIDVGITDPKLIIIMRNAYDSTGLKVDDTHQLIASYYVVEESNPESTTAGWRGRSTVFFNNGTVRASTSIYWAPVAGTSLIQCTLASGYTAPVQEWRWLAYA